MQKTVVWLLLILSASSVVFAETTSEMTAALVEKIALMVKQDVQTQSLYGYVQPVIVSKLDGEGKIREREEKVYRTTWIQGKAFYKLVSVDSRQLTPNERKMEQQRRSEFIQVSFHNKKASGLQQELRQIEWAEIHHRYEFAILPAAPGSAYTLSFRPKATTLPERNRLDRILNHLTGTVQVDENYHVIRADARLISSVKFGLGIIGTVREAEIHYTQRNWENVYLPDTLSTRWKATFALLKNDNRAMDISWKDPFLHEVEAQKTSPSILHTSRTE